MSSAKSLVKTKHSGDFVLLFMVLILSVFGTLMVFSASYYHSLNKFGNSYSFLLQNARSMGLGMIAFFFFSKFDYHRIAKYSIIIIAAGFFLLCLIFTPLGITINNATRWLDFKVMTVMPGEVIKTCLILFLAWYFAGDPERVKHIKSLLIVFGIMGASCFLIYKQPNLSTAGTVALLVVAIAVVAGMAVKWLLIAGGALGGLFLVVINSPAGAYMKERVLTALDPFADPLGNGYQVVQSLLALGSGGVLGRGIGQSIQKTLYLPEPENDFILAIIGEELGLVWILHLMVAYLLLIRRCFSVAIRAQDRYGM
ncbi:MAG: FtsW/RodA/SpoVE family cell cycle protein [Firmicutes bacterium]|nr:FtsW/RodA/SpoVE family cell cycle protein [Bacillota bacterium]